LVAVLLVSTADTRLELDLLRSIIAQSEPIRLELIFRLSYFLAWRLLFFVVRTELRHLYLGRTRILIF
jgi:hypothetical protein